MPSSQHRRILAVSIQTGLQSSKEKSAKLVMKRGYAAVTQATTRHPGRIGVQLRQQHTTYQSYADAVRRAADLGVATICGWAQFFPLTADPHRSTVEGWTLLTAMATRTQRADTGCLAT